MTADTGKTDNEDWDSDDTDDLENFDNFNVDDIIGSTPDKGRSLVTVSVGLKSSQPVATKNISNNGSENISNAESENNVKAEPVEMDINANSNGKMISNTIFIRVFGSVVKHLTADPGIASSILPHCN